MCNDLLEITVWSEAVSHRPPMNSGTLVIASRLRFTKSYCNSVSARIPCNFKRLRLGDDERPWSATCSCTPASQCAFGCFAHADTHLRDAVHVIAANAPTSEKIFVASTGRLPPTD